MKRILIIAAVLLISILLSASIIFSYPTHSGTYSISSLETKILEWFVDYSDRADRAKNGPEQIKVHPWLTLRAIELFEDTYKVTLSDLERQEIIAGSIEEDYDIEGTSAVEKWSNLDILKSLSEKELDPNYYTQSERCMNHFMDESGIGLLSPTLARMSSAKKWALDDENNSTRYTEALRLAKAGDKKGWRYLGHVLHLLQDMSVPAHVRMDPHPFNDTYERELAGKDIKGYHKLVGEDLGTPAYKADKEVLFTNLADYARKHYISDNSFGKYETPVLKDCEDEKYKNYKCNSTNTLVGAVAYKGVLHSLTKEAFTLKINDKVAESMFQDLGLASIRSGARLVELFYHEVIGYKISGRVTYNGIGLAGVGITRTRDGKSAWVGKTDTDGWYTFEDPNGTYTITPSLAYYSFNPATVSITVNNENFDVQDFTATAVSTGYTISGQVTYNGTGLAGVNVTLAGTGSSAVTAANGVYTLTNVANGNYTMTFAASGYSFDPSTKSITVNGENVLIVNNIIATVATPTGVAQWAKTLTSGTDASVFYAVSVASDGSVYAAGGIENGAYDFGNSVTATGLSNIYNILLVKYNSSGVAQWAKTVTSGTDGSRFTGVSVASDGSVYAAGEIMNGTCDFGNSVTAKGAAVGYNMLLVKYNSSGVAQWAKTLTSGTDASVFHAVSVASDGSVYAAGEIKNGAYDFGNSVTATGLSNIYNILLVKYNSSGVAQWAKTVTSGTDGSRFFGVSVASDGSVYATGSIEGTGTCSFGNSITATGVASTNILLVKYNSSGVAQWAKTLTSGTDASVFYAVSVASDGSAYAAGYIYGTGTHNFGNSVTATGLSNIYNILLVKYNSSGVAQWAKTVTSGNNASEFYAVSVASDGSAYATGSIEGIGAYDFGNSVTATAANHFDNTLLVKYNSSGVAQWAKTVISPFYSSRFSAVSAASDGSAYAAGIYHGGNTYDFGNSVTITGLSNINNILLVKYH